MATIYTAGTTGGNWTSGTTWTGGTSGYPQNGDTAIILKSSSTVYLNNGTQTCSTLVMSGGTLALTNSLVILSGGTLTGTLTGGNNFAIQLQGGTFTLGGLVGGSASSATNLILQQNPIGLVSGSNTWPGNLNLLTANSVQLLNNWTNSGLVTFQSAANVNNSGNSESLMANNGLTLNVASGVSPTATIILGGGTWSGNTALANPLTFGGNSTISGLVQSTNSTLTYSSGTITVTGSTVELNGSTVTLNTNGMSFNNLIFNNNATMTATLTSNLSVLNNFVLFNNSHNNIFSGAFNITCANLYFSPVIGGNSTVTFVSGQTINVKNSILGFPDLPTSNTIIVSASTASSPTYINYTGTLASEKIMGINFTDVYASGTNALPLYNYNGGTLTRCQNIINVTADNLFKRLQMKELT